MVVVLVAYWPATEAGFIWDDDFNVTDNIPLRSLEGLRSIWLLPRTTTQYYPMVYTSFWLEHAAWGLEPIGYHIDNLLLHAAVSILLWRCLLVLAVPGAWWAAAIFALHPLQVETVAWVTERKNLLSMFFYLASAFCFLRAAPPRPTKDIALSLLFFIAALLSKVTALILPAALLLVVWWKRGRIDRTDAISVLPMFVCAIPIGLLTRSLESELGDVLGFEWNPSLAERVLQGSHAVWHYLEKLVWPSDLTFVYPRWALDAADPAPYGYAVALVVLAGSLYALRGRIGRGPLAALLFFVGSLAPTLGILEVYYFRFSYVADHWVYPASIGPIALFAAGFTNAFRSKRAPLLMSALLLILGTMSWHYSHAFRSSETLWRDSLAKNPEAWLAHFNLGRELQHEGRNEEALPHYLRAAELEPKHPDAWTNMGLIRLQQGEPVRAIEAFEVAFRLGRGESNRRAKLHWNLGIALERTGRFDTALPHLTRGLQSQPGQAGDHTRVTRAHARLADLLARHGRADAAIDHFGRSLLRDPSQKGAHLSLGRLLLDAGRTGEATRHFQAVLGLDPKNRAATRLLNETKAGASAR